MKMDIIALAGAEHQQKTAALLAQGCARHGVGSRIVGTPSEARTEVVAYWGWRKGRELLARGKRVLVMERGYVGDRFAWTSLGWDGLNGRARFPLVPDGASRFKRTIGLTLRDRCDVGDYALVLGQVTGDASILGVDLAAWYIKATERLSETTGLPVFFRPHPVEIERRGTHAALTACAGTAAMNGALEKALAGAAAVAAYNSNSLTDAALAGVACLAGDAGAMAWPVVGRGLLDAPALETRPLWAARLAWCQWCDAEIADGRAWEAMATCIEPGSGWSPSLETRQPPPA